MLLTKTIQLSKNAFQDGIYVHLPGEVAHILRNFRMKRITRTQKKDQFYQSKGKQVPKTKRQLF